MTRVLSTSPHRPSDVVADLPAAVACDPRRGWVVGGSGARVVASTVTGREWTTGMGQYPTDPFLKGFTL